MLIDPIALHLPTWSLFVISLPVIFTIVFLYFVKRSSPVRWLKHHRITTFDVLEEQIKKQMAENPHLRRPKVAKSSGRRSINPFTMFDRARRPLPQVRIGGGQTLGMEGLAESMREHQEHRERMRRERRKK